MSTLTGTGKLIRFILRRDRFLLPVWILVFGYFPVALVPGITEVWPTQAARDSGMEMANASPAFTALLGKVFDPSVGGLVAWRGSLMCVILGIISAVTVIRHTRTDEEAGRRELIGSTVVGRHAPLAAVLIVVVVANLLVGGIAGLGMSAEGQAVEGSWMLGTQYASTGIVLAGIAAVCAQLTQGSGSARGIFFLVLGAAFLLRMTGDLNNDLDWLLRASPLGWPQLLQPFGANDWPVLLFPVAALILLTALAFVLQSHRDIEAGVLANRLGPAHAGRSLSSGLGLAWRLQRAALIGWTIGFAILGLMFGSMVNGMDELLSSSATMSDVLVQMGGTTVLTQAFIASMLGIMGLVAAGYGIQATLKPRAEETGLRAEQILATHISRLSWTGGHLVFAFVGPAVVLAAGCLGMALTYGAAISDPGTALSEVMTGWVVQLPAVWVLTGLTTLLFGLVPRLLGLAWVALTVCLLFGQLGAVLRLPQWALDLSPFTHLPQIPGDDFSLPPMLWLTGIAVAATGIGLAGFRRRDLG
jgi:ABC-2 type transport system permease protein